MCGLAGVARREPRGVAPDMLDRMARALQHRGPDGSGRYADARVGLAHVRLSIIDVAGGAQPLGNEDGSVLIVYNGEVYNYLELQAELQAAGHRFRTRCDTKCSCTRTSRSPPRFPFPLIKPDVPISGIRLSDWLHRRLHEPVTRNGPRSRNTPNSPKIRFIGN